MNKYVSKYSRHTYYVFVCTWRLNFNSIEWFLECMCDGYAVTVAVALATAAIGTTQPLSSR